MRLKDLLQFVHVVVKILILVISRSSFDEYERENCSKMRAAHAARSFWFFSPIILLLFGVVVAVAVVVSAGTHSLRQVAPCVLLAKQVAATRRLFGAHAVISYEGGCELVF